MDSPKASQRSWHVRSLQGAMSSESWCESYINSPGSTWSWSELHSLLSSTRWETKRRLPILQVALSLLAFTEGKSTQGAPWWFSKSLLRWISNGLLYAIFFVWQWRLVHENLITISNCYPPSCHWRTNCHATERTTICSCWTHSTYTGAPDWYKHEHEHVLHGEEMTSNAKRRKITDDVG